MTDFVHLRRAGLLVPLFSCPSTASWGVGEIADLAPMAEWLSGAGLSVLQLLPINEMAPGQQSPYSAISAMAIDPIYISLAHVQEFNELGGEASLDDASRARLAEVRRSPVVRHADVRELKRAALRAAFDRFFDVSWTRDTERGRHLKAFLSEQAWWVEDYAIFRAIHARERERPWLEWPEPLQRREPAAIDQARRELAREVLFSQFLQWIADTQWKRARVDAASHGVALFGDLPFMVDGDSADVWARQHQFMLDVSVGVPPDAFSATGQDWGMPVYRWDVIAREDFRWLRERARRSADLYDGYRVDHLVGFYRTYGRPRRGGAPFFTPSTEPEQISLGERVLGVLRQPGAEIIAEDLGIVPDFVRASLARLGLPGFCVFRWERHWHAEGQPFRDPAAYPPVSVATTGTHDTEPMITWWTRASEDERRKVGALPPVQRLTSGAGLGTGPYIPTTRDVLLEVVYASASSLVINPIQDVFGWADRINEPATVNEKNWSFRLPWPSDRLDGAPEAQERQQRLRAWAETYDRL